MFPYTTLFRSPSPKAAIASRRAAGMASSTSPGSAMRRMPFPPPPAADLTSAGRPTRGARRSEEDTSELQSRRDLVCRPLLEKKNLNARSVSRLGIYPGSTDAARLQELEQLASKLRDAELTTNPRG